MKVCNILFDVYYYKMFIKILFFFVNYYCPGKPITNGRVINGGITDSKINITSNPLAVLDTTDSTMQPKVRNFIMAILKPSKLLSQGSRWET